MKASRPRPGDYSANASPAGKRRPGLSLAGLIGGARFYRRLIGREPLNRQFVDQLVDALTAPADQP